MNTRRLLLLAAVVAVPLLALAPTGGVSGELERPLTIETADGERPLFAADLQQRVVVEATDGSGGAASTGGANASDAPAGPDSAVRVGTATNAFPGHDVTVRLASVSDTRDAPTVRGVAPVFVPAGTSRPVSVRIDCGDVRDATGTVTLRVTATGTDLQSSATHDLSVECRGPPSPPTSAGSTVSTTPTATHSTATTTTTPRADG